MNKNIMVIASAATEGGALEILKQFLSGIHSENDRYFVLINESVRHELPETENITYVTIDTKTWVKRLYFDFFQIKKVCRDYKIDLCINFQNIPVRVPVRQLVYLQQSIPFSDITFSFFKPEERKLWCYKKFYLFFIKLNAQYATRFIVQTNWMKKAVATILPFDNEKIDVFRPDITTVVSDLPHSSELAGHISSTDNVLFYPASHFSYKNHAILFDAFITLGQQFFKTHNLKVIFTIDKDDLSSLWLRAEEAGLNDYIEYVGKISRESVDAIYKRSTMLLFPSKLETFGMPLIEAASFRMNIIASDLPYAREVLAHYQCAYFCHSDHAEAWARAIQNVLLKPCVSTEDKPSLGPGWNEFHKLISNASKNTL